MKRWFCLFALGIVSLAGCTATPSPWKNAPAGQKRVLASFPPIYSMAKAVAGDEAYVLCLLTTVGPHDYQPHPNEMRKLRDADVIFTNGLQLDDRFMDRLLAGASVQATRVTKLGNAIPKDQLKGGVEHNGHTHGDSDPHVWLGPPQAIEMTRALAARLIELDPAHKTGYETRAAAFVKELEALQAHGKQLLAGKKNRNLLTQHESLAYFAAAFDLNVVGSIQINPGDDADSVRLGILAKQCREQNVQVIAVEPQYARGQAKNLQQQLKQQGLTVNIIEIDPIETADLMDGGPNPDPNVYLTKMRQNIENLAKALP